MLGVKIFDLKNNEEPYDPINCPNLTLTEFPANGEDCQSKTEIQVSWHGIDIINKDDKKVGSYINIDRKEAYKLFYWLRHWIFVEHSDERDKEFESKEMDEDYFGEDC